MRYYLVFNKNNIPVAYTDSYQQLKNYLEDRKDLKYRIKVEDEDDLPDEFKEALDSGKFQDYDIVAQGSFNDIYLSVRDEMILVDNLDQWFNDLPDRINLLTKHLDYIQFTPKEKEIITMAIETIEQFDSEYGVGNDCENWEDIIDWKCLLKQLIKKGLIN